MSKSRVAARAGRARVRPDRNVDPSTPDASALPGPVSEPARILAQAEQHFFTHGFHTITMDDLARDLGMSKKTLYRHYATKEALLDAVLDAFADRVSGALGTILARQREPAADRLRQLLSVVAGLLAPMKPIFLLSLQRYAPQQFQRLEQLRRRNLERHLLPMLLRASANGEIRADLDPAMVLELLLVVLQQALEPALLERLQRTPAQVVPQALDLVFRGLLTPPISAPTAVRASS